MAEKTGVFVRHELMSSDPDRSEAFFTALFGWRVERRKVMGQDVRVLFAGDFRVGGIMRFDAPPGYPSHWVGYVGVDDVDAANSKAIQLGAKETFKPMNLGPMGRAGFLNDPDGAFFHLLKPGYENPDPGTRPGTVVWNELLANEPGKALDFYAKLFGWTATTMNPGTPQEYAMLAKGETRVAGIMRRADEMGPRPRWQFYFGVGDVEAAREKVLSLGGRACTGVMPIPGTGRFAIVEDPTGAVFALFQPA